MMHGCIPCRNAAMVRPTLLVAHTSPLLSLPTLSHLPHFHTQTGPLQTRCYDYFNDSPTFHRGKCSVEGSPDTPAALNSGVRVLADADAQVAIAVLLSEGCQGESAASEAHARKRARHQCGLPPQAPVKVDSSLRPSPTRSSASARTTCRRARITRWARPWRSDATGARNAAGDGRPAA